MPISQDNVLPLPYLFSLKMEETRRGGQNLEEIVTDLYAKLRAPLLSYVYHLVGSTRDAEDLVQIAFLQLFDQLSLNTEIRNVRGWLFRVAHNLAIENASRLDRREALIQKWLPDRREPVTDSRSAEDVLIRREQIENALEKLNEKERHCLMLRAEGLSYQEIAEVLEISAKSVSVYLARGLQKFEQKNGKQN
jgi:RNA polymerase sigma-70 factor (ECF subfamily)